MSEQLNEGLFDWDDWLEDEQTARTIREWIIAFERNYFEERGKTPKTETTWDKDYRIPYGRLPQDEPLTSEVIKAGVLLTEPNTRSRKRYCMAYSALANFVNIEMDVDLKSLKGKYSPKAVNPRNIPSDELILEWEQKISDPQWKSFYRLMVIYGIRNHECWYINLQCLALDPVAKTDGKTNERLIVPFPPSWWEMWFKGQKISLPKLTVRKNSDYGALSSQYFKRLGLPFHLYDLRHAHAVRMAAAGVEGQLAPKIQGHSSRE